MRDQVIDQLHGLRRVRSRCAEALALLPQEGAGEWSGSARLAFDLSLLKLRWEAVRALEALDAAIAHSSSALRGTDWGSR